MKMIRPTAVADAAGTLTRSTTAKYVDQTGVLQTAAINEPRLDYHPMTNVFRGLLYENAATNVQLQSQTFDNASWTKSALTPTPNVATAPDNTLTGDLLVDTPVATSHGIYRNSTLLSNVQSVFSVWVQAAGRTSFYMDIMDSVATTNGAQARYDLTTGTVYSKTAAGAATGLDAGIEQYPNGWFRCWVTGTPSATTNVCRPRIYLTLSPAGSTSYTGDGVSGVYLWGAQHETGSVPTSYITTTTAALTRAADVLTNSGLLYSTEPETDFAAWNAATSYTVGTKVIRTTAATHKIYQNLIAGVDATAPEVSALLTTPRWLDCGATNKWAMFDSQVGTATTSAGTSMTVLIAPGRINSLALLAVDATKIEISLSIPGQVVYLASVDMAGGNTVGDWYQYFYEPVYQQDALVVTDLVDASLLNLPVYTEGILAIRMSKTTGTVSCGVAVVGLYAELGDTQYQPTIGITDYSRKDIDVFGRPTIVKRAYSKRMNAKVALPNSTVDNVSRVLAQYRSTPVVWVGAGSIYTSMIIYGFYKDWDISIENYSLSTLNLQVEGLT